MSHPKQARLFKAWSAAMLEGATVGTPDYGKKASKIGLSSKTQGPAKRRRRKRWKRRKKKMVHAEKIT